MSNVLIGIIGVILFIGLALAGALFLGPRFQEAAANSDAAAATSTIQQIQSAYALKSVETGADVYITGTVDELVPGYMKSAPVNPSKAGRQNPTSYLYVPHVNNDLMNDTHDEGRQAISLYVMMAIGTDGYAKSVCDSMNRGLGIATMPVISDTNRYPKQNPIACGYHAPYYTAYAMLKNP